MNSNYHSCQRNFAYSRLTDSLSVLYIGAKHDFRQLTKHVLKPGLALCYEVRCFTFDMLQVYMYVLYMGSKHDLLQFRKFVYSR